MHHLCRFTWIAAVAMLSGAACSRTFSDDAIAAQIRAKFSGDPVVKLAPIRVAVSKGEVTVAGAVASADVELKALTLASGTEGVRHLNDRMTIAPGGVGQQEAAMAVRHETRGENGDRKTPGRKWLYQWPQETGLQEQKPQEPDRADDRRERTRKRCRWRSRRLS